MKKVFSTTILCLSAMTQMMAQNIMGKVVRLRLQWRNHQGDIRGLQNHLQGLRG